jgi:MerR family transcriptional regulator, thiopeptide resistance regulator
MPRQQQVWKVGELAGRTGLTVRTLHHYDRIGLLSPSGRTGSNHGAGHRLYTAADVARLQQILSLKMLGFGLEQIREYLSRGDYDPRRVVRLHLERVRGQADELRRLAERLAALADALDRAEVVSADEFLATIEVMTMIEKYYTPEQLAQIEARKAALGEERIKEANAEWPRLFAGVRAEMDAGTDPADPKVQALARKWYGLLDEFTGGDPGLFTSTRNMYANEDRIREMDVKAMRPMFAYIRKAAAASGIELPGA